jgi:hypothetical protein
MPLESCIQKQQLRDFSASLASYSIPSRSINFRHVKKMLRISRFILKFTPSKVAPLRTTRCNFFLIFLQGHCEGEEEQLLPSGPHLLVKQQCRRLVLCRDYEPGWRDELEEQEVLRKDAGQFYAPCKKIGQTGLSKLLQALLPLGQHRISFRHLKPVQGSGAGSSQVVLQGCERDAHQEEGCSNPPSPKLVSTVTCDLKPRVASVGAR